MKLLLILQVHLFLDESPKILILRGGYYDVRENLCCCKGDTPSLGHSAGPAAHRCLLVGHPSVDGQLGVHSCGTADGAAWR